VSEGPRLLLALVLPALLVFLTVPIAIAVARRTGFVDSPSGYKAHLRPTPYLGGSAVMVAALPVAAVLALGGLGAYWPILAGAGVLWAVGTVDDRVNLSPWLRVALEIAVAWLLWDQGIGWSFLDSGAANLLLTAFWVVAIVNAFNLMDNLDGAASTVGVVCAAAAAAIASIGGATALAVIAISLCGALLGFLRFNLAKPARIFLGDGGSMPVGFLIAATLMAAPMGATSGWATVAVAGLAAGLPIFDTTLVVISRRRRGAQVLSGATDHTTHRLRALVGTPQAVCAVLAVVQAVLCGFAIEATRLGDGAVIAFVAVAAALGAAAIAFEEGPRWTPLSDDS
jgi:UDP-GlcNAc:undecaprenyl-phosphate GlcNAc-1-phosphate transferase